MLNLEFFLRFFFVNRALGRKTKTETVAYIQASKRRQDSDLVNRQTNEQTQ